MKLLQEIVPNVEVINEESEGKRSTWIRGPFIVAETKNRNNRIYPAHIVEKEVARYRTEYIDKKRSLGELSHPPTPQINYERASHLITELTRDGNAWIGKAKVLESLPMGKIAKGLLDEGIAVGVSTRGLGSLSDDDKLGAKIVGADFRLCAIDLVSDPSAPGAFVEGLVEGVEWVWDVTSDSYIQQKLQEIKQQVKRAPKAELPKVMTEAYDRFFRLLYHKSTS